MESFMSPSPNRFLQSLNRGDFAVLRPHLRDVELAHSAILFDVGHEIERIYFPSAGVVSLVVVLTTGEIIEAGMIGPDGVVGTSAALHGGIALYRAVVQIQGTASYIDATAARAAVTTSKSLRLKLYEQDQLLLAQAQQSAACNATHNIEERLCRWLLRTRDLVGGDVFALTQEFMAQMLGVRRTGVTLAAHHLQKIGLIEYQRGQVRILDAEGLQEAACECHGAFKDLAARLLAGAPTPRLSLVP
jgi:CRP-like cAMP-binding protein